MPPTPHDRPLLLNALQPPLDELEELVRQGVPIERSLLSSREILECPRIASTGPFDEMLELAFGSRAQLPVNARSRLRIR